MKSIKLAAILYLIAFSVSFAQTNTWKFDLAHTNVQFSVSHMVISSVTGKFKKFDGVVTSEKTDFQDAKIEFNIESSSISTDNDKRDEHLRSADFFDVQKFSQIKFQSVSFKKIKDNKYKLTGNFTMKDVTKKITLDAEFNGTIKDPWGNTKAGFKLTGTINRFDYHLNWNKTIEAGGLVAGKDVDFTIYVELQKN
ncbi:MAG: YceI family protein [Bacteroidota bacterium]|jgi:polyisoprenoid-binding protein YceI